MKKKLTCLLAAALCLAAMPLGAGAYYTDITGLSDEFGEGGYSINSGALEKYTALSDFAYLSNVAPGTTYFLPLRAKDFEWEGDERGHISADTVEELGFELDVYYERGDEALDAIKLAQKGSQVGILVDFVDEWPFVEEQSFSAKCSLIIGGVEYEGCEFRVRGTMSNREVLVDTYDTSCTLGVGRYAYGFDNVKNVRFKLGAGVTVTSDITFTDKYYGAATRGAQEADKDVLAKYPQIKNVYYLDTVGLTGSVTIESDEVLYIYDSTLVYLGTTDQPVKFRTKYYTAGSKL